MRLVLEQSFNTAVRPSPRVLHTALMFGIGVDETRQVTVVPRTAIDLPSRGMVFITGPSGSGKSSILRAIVAQLREIPCAIIDLNELEDLPDAPLVDVFDVPLAQATSLLAMAGLGDAFIMLRRPRELSDGQRARLRLAHAMLLATRHEHAIIIADEFTATLDRLTARIISRNIRRWLDRSPRDIIFIAATTHEDVAEALAPEVLIYKGLGDEVKIIHSPSLEGRGSEGGSKAPAGARCAPLAATHAPAPSLNGWGVRIEPATSGGADYASLAQFHYRSERPGVVTSAFRLVHDSPGFVGRYLKRRSEAQVIGILLRSLPHLSCSLRDLATRGRYRGLGNREAAAVLNREVRTISRVVIHPQWRGLGLAVDLVRHALAHPEDGQVFTEALAAMGHVHPFFERAGMTRYDRPPQKEHARLLDAMDRLDIEPFMLASPRLFIEKLRERDEQAQVWFEHELARWVRNGPRRPRKRRETPIAERTLEEMLATARDQLLSLPVYYVFHHT